MEKSKCLDLAILLNSTNFQTILNQSLTTQSTTTTTTVPDNTTPISITPGNGLSGGGSFTMNQQTPVSITLSHADTSTQGSTNNTQNTVIQNILVDGYGHVTSITSKTLTALDLGAGSLSSDNIWAGSNKFNKSVSYNGSIASTGAIDCSLGNIFSLNVTAATSVSFINVPTGFYSLLLFIVNGGSNTITWPTSIKWDNNTAPALSVTGTDILVFNTIDGGITWYGIVSGVGFV